MLNDKELIKVVRKALENEYSYGSAKAWNAMAEAAIRVVRENTC